MDAETKKTLSLKSIRGKNIANILQSLLKAREMARSDLAAENQISVMTVKHIADDLLARGVVVERPGEGGEVGRKPRVLQISEQYGHIICINLTAAGAVTFLIYDIYETLLDEQIFSFDQAKSYQDNLTSAMIHIKACSDAQRTDAVGCAAFVPSAYYEEEDLINYDLIGEFKQLHIKSLLEQTFQLKNILVLHDVFPAAWSEYDSLDPMSESQFYFYCGHGVGGLFIHKNVAVMGENLMAGEVGKMLLPTKESGKLAIVEDCIAVPALLAAYGQPGADMARLLHAYEAGEARARAVLDPALDQAARLLYNLLWIYNPTRLVVDSCNKEYSALIIKRTETLLQSVRSEAIPIHVQLRTAKYDEYHLMRGCFHMVRDCWARELTQE